METSTVEVLSLREKFKFPRRNFFCGVGHLVRLVINAQKKITKSLMKRNYRVEYIAIGMVTMAIMANEVD